MIFVSDRHHFLQLLILDQLSEQLSEQLLEQLLVQVSDSLLEPLGEHEIWLQSFGYLLSVLCQEAPYHCQQHSGILGWSWPSALIVPLI
jgi:hypothetical protein